jgi:hypothetical protein
MKAGYRKTVRPVCAADGGKLFMGASSDPTAVKPANKAVQPAAELVEPRAGTKGNADRQSTHWTQSQPRVSQALERIRQAVAVTHPRWEPHAGKPHVRICAGGARQLASLPLNPKHPPGPPMDLANMRAECLNDEGPPRCVF